MISRFGLLTLVFALSAAIASATIDQQNTAANSFFGPSISPGQSFTPTLSGIDFASFELATNDGVNGALVFVTLYQGDGFGGTVLATSSNNQLVTNTSSFQEYTFNFAPTVSLTPGNVYTLQLTDSSGQTIYDEETSGTSTPAASSTTPRVPRRSVTI